MPRGRHPRRRKRDGETWHKRKGPHKKHAIYVLCFRCTSAVCTTGWRRHARACFGIRRCFACELPFPCRNKLCPWSAAIERARVVVPPRFLPYFWRRNPLYRKPRMTPIRALLERPALRWLEKVRNQ